MISLMRLNGQPFILNSDLIKLIENAPDTVITLINGEKIVVREPSGLILERIVAFRRCVLEGLQTNCLGCLPPKEQEPMGQGKDPASGEA